MSAGTQVLTDLKYVLTEDAGLDLHARPPCFPKDISQQSACDVAQNMIDTIGTLATLSGNASLASFCPEGFVGISVPINTFTLIASLLSSFPPPVP
jgi:hypothetical protein